PRALHSCPTRRSSDLCLSGDGAWLPSATVSQPAAFEFRALPVDQCPQFGIVESINLHYLAIEHHFRWIAVDNRRDGQLRVVRRSDRKSTRLNSSHVKS